MLPSEFTFIQRGWLNCNSILIQGDGPPALVDSGHLRYVDESLSLIRQAGVEPETIKQIATTHCHCDHHGANKTIKALSGATVGMGPLTAEWFATNEMRLTWFDQLSQDADTIPADEIYSEGDIVSLSGVPFEIVSLPGHAPDSIGFFQPDTRVLIGADAMWENDLGVLHTAVHGPSILDDAELAVRKIMQLDPAVVIPGHGNLITNVQENGEKVLKRITSFRQEPSRAAWHIARRFMMYGILTLQPLSRNDYIRMVIKDGWVFDYLDDINLHQEKRYTRENIEALFHDMADEFISRGLVVEKDGILTSLVPK